MRNRLLSGTAIGVALALTLQPGATRAAGRRRAPR